MCLALASVSDKTGIENFAKRLEKKSFNFIASGGTAKTLKNAGLKVTEVSDYTGSSEILSGRVKTLHPSIHGGILARNDEESQAQLKQLNIENIDVVIVNLYPFEKTVATSSSSEMDCIENIDIGGVALLRAAAKNYERVTVVCSPDDYNAVATEIEQTGTTSIKTRKMLALKAFSLCAKYDTAIAGWLKSSIEKDINCQTGTNTKNEYVSTLDFTGFFKQDLRYGENPHQKAWYYLSKKNNSDNEKIALGGKVLQGKELSYNNLLDTDVAWRAVSIFEKPAAVVVKHLTPCGIAELCNEDQGIYEALEVAIDCDRISAYGSIIALNRTFDEKAFVAVEKLFTECIIAPKFSEGAKKLLAKKKNLRLIEAPLSNKSENYEIKSVLGGYLCQEKDFGDPVGTEYKNVTNRKVTAEETELLKFAMKACIMVKSNAILLAAPISHSDIIKGYCTVGIGCGQPNRVDATRHAIQRAGKKIEHAVLASDAFLPFADTVEVAAEAGIRSIIQPGGSIHDDSTIEACNKHNIAMLVTAVRHFKH